MQLTNRALTKEFQKMRADASAVSEFRDKIEIMVEKLNVVKQLQDDVTALKEQVCIAIGLCLPPHSYPT